MSFRKEKIPVHLKEWGRIFNEQGELAYGTGEYKVKGIMMLKCVFF